MATQFTFATWPGRLRTRSPWSSTGRYRPAACWPPRAKPPKRIQLIIRNLEGNQYFTRNAYIDMDLTVADRSGRTIHRDTVKDQRSETALFSTNIETLQNQVQDLLNATVDRMLDNPKLRAVLSSRLTRSGATSA